MQAISGWVEQRLNNKVPVKLGGSLNEGENPK